MRPCSTGLPARALSPVNAARRRAQPGNGPLPGCRVDQYSRTAVSKAQVRRISITSNWRARFGAKAW